MMRNCLNLCFVVAFAVGTLAGRDFLWGKIGANDYLIAKDTVRKMFIIGLSVTQRYNFKQKNNSDAFTITAIKVTDQKPRNGAEAVLLGGGPGAKGCIIKFTSERGSSIKDFVEIYGR